MWGAIGCPLFSSSGCGRSARSFDHVFRTQGLAVRNPSIQHSPDAELRKTTQAMNDLGWGHLIL